MSLGFSQVFGLSLKQEPALRQSQYLVDTTGDVALFSLH
jgi:hypothetical protein